MISLEDEILVQSRIVLQNPDLTRDDLLEWSTRNVRARMGEVVVRIPNPGANICVAKQNDRRTAAV